MSPRSLLNIILKVMGIYFVKEVLLLIPQLLSSFYFLTENFKTGGWFILFSTVIMLAVYILVIFYLVLDTDAVIDRFELTKGIDEENLSITVHRSTVLSITILLVAIVMIATTLPYFLQSAFNYFREKRTESPFSPMRPDPTRLILYGAELLIAILLMIYQKTLVNFIEQQRRRNQSADT